MSYKPKVYLPNQPTRWDGDANCRAPSIDFTPAKRHGELITLTEGPVYPQRLPEIRSVISEAALSSNSLDYILCAGESIALACAMQRFEIEHGAINLLRWDRETKKYKIFKGIFL